MVQIGEFQVDLTRRIVTRNGEFVPFSRTEWLLLQHLATNVGRVMTHGELLTEVWGPEYRDDLTYLRLWIGRLRRKLGVEPGRRGRSGRSRGWATRSTSTALSIEPELRSVTPASLPPPLAAVDA